MLSDFNLQVRKNEFVAVVGENGSGKSTLIKILLGFYKADGKISFDGKAYGDYKVSEIRNKIAYVPQNQVLYDDTIFENIRCGRLDATEEVIEYSKKANKIIFLQNGAIAEEGTFQTLIEKKGKYAKMYDLQSSVS